MKTNNHQIVDYDLVRYEKGYNDVTPDPTHAQE